MSDTLVSFDLLAGAPALEADANMVSVGGVAFRATPPDVDSDTLMKALKSL